MRNSTRQMLSIQTSHPSLDIPLQTSLIPRRAQNASPTFTRSSTATVTDFEGIVRTVKVGEARFAGARRVENLIPQSESDSNWAANGTTPPTVNKSLIYNGKLCVSATFGAITGGSYTVSRATGSAAQIRLGGTYRNRFIIAADRPLVAGEEFIVYVTGTYGGCSISFYGTTRNLSTEWQHFSAPTLTNTVGNGGDYFTAYAKTTFSPITIYLSERQLEEVGGQSNQNPSEYVSTGIPVKQINGQEVYHGANVDGVKYFNYLNGTSVGISSYIVTEGQGELITANNGDITVCDSSGPFGYFAEASRTNLFLYYNDFANGAWNKANVTVNSTNTVNPFGLIDTDIIIPTANNSNKLLYQDRSLTTGLDYTQTVYAKAAGYNYLQIAASTGFNTSNAWATFDLSTGLIGSQGTGTFTSNISAKANGWYEINFTAPALISGAGRMVFCVLDADYGTRLPPFIGDEVSGVYLAGAQIESGSFATSIIPTTSAAVTRAADSLIYPSVGNIDGTRGTCYTEVSFTDVNALAPPRFVSVSSTVERNILYVAHGTNGKNIGIYDGVSGVNIANSAIADGTVHKCGSSWGNNTMSVFANTANISTAFSGDMNVGSIIAVGRLGNLAGYELNGTIRNVKIWKKPLLDAKMIRITT